MRTCSDRGMHDRRACDMAGRTWSVRSRHDKTDAATTLTCLQGLA